MTVFSLGTVDCKAVPVNIGKSKVLLIDTPGFDDSSKTDSMILTEISRLLAAQYEAGVSLKGVIYLHRISDVRYSGSSVKTLDRRWRGSMVIEVQQTASPANS